MRDHFRYTIHSFRIGNVSHGTSSDMSQPTSSGLDSDRTWPKTLDKIPSVSIFDSSTLLSLPLAYQLSVIT